MLTTCIRTHQVFEPWYMMCCRSEGRLGSVPTRELQVITLTPGLPVAPAKACFTSIKSEPNWDGCALKSSLEANFPLQYSRSCRLFPFASTSSHPSVSLMMPRFKATHNLAPHFPRFAGDEPSSQKSSHSIPGLRTHSQQLMEVFRKSS